MLVCEVKRGRGGGGPAWLNRGGTGVDMDKETVVLEMRGPRRSL
jgi:hypothetical protein